MFTNELKRLFKIRKEISRTKDGKKLNLLISEFFTLSAFLEQVGAFSESKEENFLIARVLENTLLQSRGNLYVKDMDSSQYDYINSYVNNCAKLGEMSKEIYRMEEFYPLIEKCNRSENDFESCVNKLVEMLTEYLGVDNYTLEGNDLRTFIAKFFSSDHLFISNQESGVGGVTYDTTFTGSGIDSYITVGASNNLFQVVGFIGHELGHAYANSLKKTNKSTMGSILDEVPSTVFERLFVEFCLDDPKFKKDALNFELGRNLYIRNCLQKNIVLKKMDDSCWTDRVIFDSYGNFHFPIRRTEDGLYTLDKEDNNEEDTIVIPHEGYIEPKIKNQFNRTKYITREDNIIDDDDINILNDSDSNISDYLYLVGELFAGFFIEAILRNPSTGLELLKDFILYDMNRPLEELLEEYEIDTEYAKRSWLRSYAYQQQIFHNENEYGKALLKK